MKAMSQIWRVTVALAGLAGATLCAAQSQWERPTTELAEEIAGILGPGQAHLTIRNLSSIPSDEIPTIRRLLAQDLKGHGVILAGTESANSVRVTLSENARERLLVAEIVEGNQTQVTMVSLGKSQTQQRPSNGALTLTDQQILATRKAVLAVLETPSGIVVLEPEQIATYAREADSWKEEQRVSAGSSRAQARDPRGVLLGYASGSSFEAWLPGTHCSGGTTAASQTAHWAIQCHESDDPWAITQPPLDLTDAGSANDSQHIQVVPIRAFYNAARNFFTGVLVNGTGPDLPPFYELAVIPRASGSGALLVGGIDGKVQIVKNNALHPGAGTRDWGSDFAVLLTTCNAGSVIIASSSGEAASDSLRAYSLPALEAVPASAPLAVNGMVTALWTAPDGKSVFAVVRNAANEYEVDRVTALCN